MAALVLTLVVGPVLGRLHVPELETWGILALHVLAGASFASIMSVLLGRWAIVPTWLFFVVLGNSSSGGAVSPPPLPAPFAFLAQWLPSSATASTSPPSTAASSCRRVQPGLGGLMDDALWTLAPIFAVVLATHEPITAFFTRLATPLGAAVTMASSWGVSDTGDLTGRGSPFVCGAMAVADGGGGARVAGGAASGVVPGQFARSFISVAVGGAIIAGLSSVLGAPAEVRAAPD